MSNLKIGIVGLGMVGEPLKKYFELKGFKRGRNLFCSDTDPGKKYNDDVGKADAVFVSVPTPSRIDGSCDTSIVEEAVAKYASSAKVTVIKSTVPPGTTEYLAKKYKCALVFSPEFLTEANAWENMTKPDRQIVAPAAKAKAEAMAILRLLPPARFTSPKHKKADRWAELNATEAELGKYAANAFGALKVSFANLVYDLAKMTEESLNKNGVKTKVNYNNIRHVLAEDQRIGSAWLNVEYQHYRGYGGYCFPKDTGAIIAYGRKIIQKTPKGAKKRLFEKGVGLLEAMRAYNGALLASQGLTVENVSRHDAELAKVIKINRIKNK